MELSREFIACFLQSEQTVTFVSDSSLQINQVSASAPFQPGVPLSAVFGGETAEYTHAVEDLRSGSVFFSTKFELFRHFSSCVLIPVLENGVLSHVLGVLNTENQQDERRPVSLMTMVSDRYRTPVSNILNILFALSTALRTEEYDRERTYLNAAARECYSILRTVVPSHDYYLLVNDQMPFAPQTLIVADLLEDLCMTLRPFFRKRGQKLVLCTKGETVSAQLDTRLFSLALFHLIANAAQFSPRDSTITLSFSCTKHQCTVAVSDEGDGISSENLPRVFEPFFTGNDVPRPESQFGMGLGLPIVREIARLHGGDVLLTSEENRGTSAVLRIPVSEKSDGSLVRADTSKFVADKFSDLYVLFADLCEINLFYPSVE